MQSIFLHQQSTQKVGAGQRLRWTVAAGAGTYTKTTLTYDSFNREATRTIDFLDGVQGNAINTAQPLATIIITRTYGADNRLQSSAITQRSPGSTQLTNILTMDLSADNAYDTRQRLTNVAYTGSSRPLMHDGVTPIDAIAYTHDALNNITSVTRSSAAGDDVMTYHRADGTSFQIDAITHALAGGGTDTLNLSHDPATGAVTSIGDTTCTYDALGRLSRASQGEGASAKAASYRHDALDRLICETPDGAQPRYFIYAGDTLAALVDGAPAGNITQFLHAAGGPVSEIHGQDAILLATDAGGTPVAYASLDDLDEQLEQGLLFIPRDPYGAAPQAFPENAPVTGYNGHCTDRTFQIQHLGNGHRAYHPQFARFLAPDTESPFGNGGINPYAYCENDPVNFNDPTGKMKWWKWCLYIATAVAAVAIIAAPVLGPAIGLAFVADVSTTTIISGEAFGISLGVWSGSGITQGLTKPGAASYSTSSSGDGHNSQATEYRTAHEIHKWSGWAAVGSLFVFAGSFIKGWGDMIKAGAKRGAEATVTEAPAASPLADAATGTAKAAETKSVLPQPTDATNNALLNPGHAPTQMNPGYAPPDISSTSAHASSPSDRVFPGGKRENYQTWLQPKDVSNTMFPRANNDVAHGAIQT